MDKIWLLVLSIISDQFQGRELRDRGVMYNLVDIQCCDILVSGRHFNEMNAKGLAMTYSTVDACV